MLSLARLAHAAPVAFVLGAVTLSPSAAGAYQPATARTAAATSVTDTAATLAGVVNGGSRSGSYFFQYGTTMRYGAFTSPGSVAPGADQPVSAGLTGLTPGTVYHFRLVVTTSGGNGALGLDQSFTTAPAPAPPAPAPAPPAPAPAPAPVPALAPPALAPAPHAVIGKSVAVAPLDGTVQVQVPGAKGFTQLTAGGAVPVGATLDTRAGTVQLATALPGGRSQVGAFGGALFQVLQAASGKGMTDLVLRGGDFSACPRRSSGATARAAAVRRRKPPVRTLWGQDKGGRFRTHGRDSVATVRGTRWVTTDTCAGTRTTVMEGAVAVRDRGRHRTVVVRSGHSYLARAH